MLPPPPSLFLSVSAALSLHFSLLVSPSLPLSQVSPALSDLLRLDSSGRELSVRVSLRAPAPKTVCAV